MDVKQVRELVRKNRPANKADGFPVAVQAAVAGFARAHRVGRSGGKTYPQMSKMIGVSENSIKRWIAKHGVDVGVGGTTSGNGHTNGALYAVTVGNEVKEFAALDGALAIAGEKGDEGCKLWKLIEFEIVRTARVKE